MGPVDMPQCHNRTSRTSGNGLEPTLLTVGHGTLSSDALTERLRKADATASP